MDIQLLNPWQNSARLSAYKLYANLIQEETPEEFIFILGHMRSGSSLLTRLLSSHDDICGYGELHLSYRKPSDFNAIVGKLLFREHPFLQAGRERYVLDKLLHNYQLHLTDVSMLTQVPSRIIFLLREPQGTLASQMKTFGHSEKEAIAYYTTRLACLEQYAQVITKEMPCLYLRYDQLLQQTDKTLQLLQNYLDLEMPLSTTYKVPRREIKNHNDPSINLQAGVILRNKPKVSAPKISADTLWQGEQAFAHCLQTLETYCQSINST